MFYDNCDLSSEIDALTNKANESFHKRLLWPGRERRVCLASRIQRNIILYRVLFNCNVCPRVK